MRGGHGEHGAGGGVGDGVTVCVGSAVGLGSGVTISLVGSATASVGFGSIAVCRLLQPKRPADIMIIAIHISTCVICFFILLTLNR